MKIGLPFRRHFLQPLPKSLFITLGLTLVASTVDAENHEKVLGSGSATLVISNKEMGDIIRSNHPEVFLGKGVLKTCNTSGWLLLYNENSLLKTLDNY